jgi:hypothetical protein
MATKNLEKFSPCKLSYLKCCTYEKKNFFFTGFEVAQMLTGELNVCEIGRAVGHFSRHIRAKVDLFMWSHRVAARIC